MTDMTDAELIESARMVGPDNVGMLPRLDLIIQDLADALERHQLGAVPDYTDFRIESVWLFTQIDAEDGEEGVVGFLAPGGVMMPMVASDRRRFVILCEKAKEITTATGTPIQVSRFDTRVPLGEISS